HAQIPITPKAAREAKVGEGSEKNAFINFDIQLPTVGVTVESPVQPDQDDPEIAALFEGEPVNSADIREEALKSARSPLPGPSYMAWLEPLPVSEVPGALQAEEPRETSPGGAAGGGPCDTTDMEVYQDSTSWQEESALNVPPAPEAESLAQEAPETQATQVTWNNDEPGDQFADRASEQSASESKEKERDRERAVTGEHSRAAIEE